MVERDINLEKGSIKKTKKIVKKLSKKVRSRLVRRFNLKVKKHYKYLHQMQLLKNGFLWTDIRKVNYYLILKFTLNNFFAYVYNREIMGRNVQLLKKVLKKRSKEAIEQDKAIVKCMYRSLGTVGFKGPAKKGDIAIYSVGFQLGKKLREKKIDTVNLIVRNKMSRKVREFFRGLREHKIKFRYVYVIPKFAHNGCRLRKRKRR